jgi:hypothetical protein
MSNFGSNWQGVSHNVRVFATFLPLPALISPISLQMIHSYFNKSGKGKNVVFAVRTTKLLYNQ